MTVAGTPSWGHFSGAQVETLMAVFLLRENVLARARTPSSGDGGVDIYEPHGDGYRVYQVKNFSGRLGSSEKSQIKKSLNRLRANPRLDAPVAEWLLTVPTELTSGEEDWFRDILTDGVSFPCDWRGESFWISHCARYPDVVDFFLGNGKERLRRNQQNLAELLADPQNELLPVDVEGRFRSLRQAINQASPFYRYEIRTSATEPDTPTDTDGFVATRVAGSASNGFLAWDIYEKFPQASTFDPLALSMTLRVVGPEGAWDLTSDYEDHLGFGTALELPQGAIEKLKIDAPGGLTEQVPSAGGQIGPAYVTSFVPQSWRLQVEGSHGEVEAEILLHMPTMTQGQAGVEVKGADPTETLALSLRAVGGENPKTTVNLAFCGIAGKRAADVMPAMSTFAALAEHQTLVLRPEFGPDEFFRYNLTSPEEWIELRRLASGVRDLVLIQSSTFLPVIVPDEIGPSEERSVAEAARLLSGGELTGTWTGGSFALEAGTSAADVRAQFASPAPLAIEEQLRVTIGETTFDLGKTHTIFASAVAAGTSGPNSVDVAPGIENGWVRRLGPIPGVDASGGLALAKKAPAKKAPAKKAPAKKAPAKKAPAKKAPAKKANESGPDATLG